MATLTIQLVQGAFYSISDCKPMPRLSFYQLSEAASVKQ